MKHLNYLKMEDSQNGSAFVPTALLRGGGGGRIADVFPEAAVAELEVNLRHACYTQHKGDPRKKASVEEPYV